MDSTKTEPLLQNLMITKETMDGTASTSAIAECLLERSECPRVAKKISFLDNTKNDPSREDRIKTMISVESSAQRQSMTESIGSSRSFSVFGISFGDRRETRVTVDGPLDRRGTQTSKKRRATAISTLFMPLDTHRIFAAKMKINKMISTRSLSWTCVLVQLVLSCAALLGSLGVIAAILQSKSIYPERNGTPSVEWWLVSLLSLFMIGASILAMFGLAAKNTHLIVPHIILLALCSVFVGWCLYIVVAGADPSDFNWWLSLGALSTAEFFLITSLILEVKVAVSVT